MGLMGSQVMAVSGSNRVCLPGDVSRFDIWNKRVTFNLIRGRGDGRGCLP